MEATCKMSFPTCYMCAKADAEKYSGLISMSISGTYTISQDLTRAIDAATQELDDARDTLKQQRAAARGRRRR